MIPRDGDGDDDDDVGVEEEKEEAWLLLLLLLLLEEEVWFAVKFALSLLIALVQARSAQVFKGYIVLQEVVMRMPPAVEEEEEAPISIVASLFVCSRWATKDSKKAPNSA